jgi:hypothetical protein
MKDNDSYTDSAEVEAVDALRQQQHGEGEYFNAVTAGSTGQAYPDDPFYGGTTDDVKARRHARGAYAKEDFEPTPLDPVDNYRGPTTGAEVTTQQELMNYANYKESLLQEKYPDYHAIIDRYVVPRLREEGVDPQQLLDWVLQNDDFAERAYQAGLAAKKRLSSKLPTAKEIRNMSGEEFEEILAKSRSAGEPEESEESDEFISRREMKRMNRITNPVDFAAALDRMKWGG